MAFPAGGRPIIWFAQVVADPTGLLFFAEIRKLPFLVFRVREIHAFFGAVAVNLQDFPADCAFDGLTDHCLPGGNTDASPSQGNGNNDDRNPAPPHKIIAEGLLVEDSTRLIQGWLGIRIKDVIGKVFIQHGQIFIE